MSTCLQPLATTSDFFQLEDGNFRYSSTSETRTAQAWGARKAPLWVIGSYLYSLFGTAKNLCLKGDQPRFGHRLSWGPDAGQSFDDSEVSTGIQSDYLPLIVETFETQSTGFSAYLCNQGAVTSKGITWILQSLLAELSAAEPDCYTTTLGHYVVEFHLAQGRISLCFMPEAIQFMSYINGELANELFSNSMPSIPLICELFETLLQHQPLESV